MLTLHMLEDLPISFASSLIIPVNSFQIIHRLQTEHTSWFVTLNPEEHILDLRPWIKGLVLSDT